MEKYQPNEIEPKWQKIWEDKRIYQPDLQTAKQPFYNLMMFPYPSAEGLHVGSVFTFTGVDIYGRFKRMEGYDVFEPIGLDGFGINSENYAIKVGRHPKEQAKLSEKNFYRQLHVIGNSFDWSQTVETYDPRYYKWTQWIFIQLFKKGLAYRKKSPVNFCPKDKTVLADEQVIDGKCERCGSVVEKRDLEQWFFKITEYADRLLAGLDKIDWTEKVKIAQRNWIGRKEGINIIYKVEGSNEKVITFTTRPDTNFGATFIVLGPEHPLIEKVTKKEYLDRVKKYIAKATTKPHQERIAGGRKKTGVFTGSYTINNLNGKRLPIWVSDFVIGNVGTGAVVGVPGHDIRDFEFAKTFDLPIVRVVVGKDRDSSPITKPEQVQEEEGTMINSEFLDGLDIHVATKKIMDYMQEKGWGERVTSYHLRDWLISRQRYWGPPIAMIYCQSCADRGESWFTTEEAKRQAKIRNSKFEIRNSAQWAAGWQPVPEKDLPVLLPDVKDWKPKGTGASPLASVESFVNTTCPNCGGKARRETDVSDTFLDSSWYFFRYISTEFDDRPWDKKRAEKWLPVSMYIGGAEHAVLHLLYTRFLTMVFHDLKLTDFDEPFPKFRTNGLLIKEGAKMSKSRGNIVEPDPYIKKYGADTLRSYLMFLGPFSQGGDFYDSSIGGVYRFLQRVYNFVLASIEQAEKDGANSTPSGEAGLRGAKEKSADNNRENKIVEAKLHQTIKKVSEDIEALRFNTSVAALMELMNAFQKYQTNVKVKYLEQFLLMLAPFAPHLSEELWQQLRILTHKDNQYVSIHVQRWPSYDPKLFEKEEVTIVVQVNGKVRDELKIKNEKGKMKNEIEKEARKSEKVKKYLGGKTVRKVIYVEGKILNFVVG